MGSEMCIRDSSYCLLHRSNVRIDALYNYLPRKITAILDVVGLLLLFYFMSIMTYYAMVSFVDSWVNNSVSITTLGTPQWIPQLFWVAGLILFFVTLIFVVFILFYACCCCGGDRVCSRSLDRDEGGGPGPAGMV